MSVIYTKLKSRMDGAKRPLIYLIYNDSSVPNALARKVKIVASFEGSLELHKGMEANKHTGYWQVYREYWNIYLQHIYAVEACTKGYWTVPSQGTL